MSEAIPHTPQPVRATKELRVPAEGLQRLDGIYKGQTKKLIVIGDQNVK